MPINVITFDLDDTLWAIAPVIERAERLTHAWLQAHYPAVAQAFDTDALRALRAQITQEDPGRAHDLTHLRSETYRRAAQQSGCDGAQVAAGALAVFVRARHEVTLFEEVLPTLTALKQSYRLGALSNGNADLSRLGMGHLFDFALCARTVGQPKPHMAMFAAACRTARVRPEQIVHVGDHPEHDVGGAYAAGMRAVWINRGGQPWPGGPLPHAQIRSLSELPGLLADW